MTRTITAIFTLLAMAYSAAGVAQSADLVEELKACAKMTDRDARFACFDILGQRVLAEESAYKEPAPGDAARPDATSITTATDAPPLPNDLGVPGPSTISYSAKVTSCKQGHHGDWYFYFDDGQVWKEVSTRSRRYKECDFDVTVTKDRFGYKMRIDTLDKTIRVRRHQ